MQGNQDAGHNLQALEERLCGRHGILEGQAVLLTGRHTREGRGLEGLSKVLPRSCPLGDTHTQAHEHI